jgi:hypothetical protein
MEMAEKEVIVRSPHLVMTLQMYDEAPWFKVGSVSMDLKLVGLVYQNDEFLMRKNSMNTDISNKTTVFHRMFSDDWVSFYSKIFES